MEYLPIQDLDDYGAAPRPCAVTVAMLEALAEDVDLYIWQNSDIDPAKLLETVKECCVEAGLSAGEA